MPTGPLPSGDAPPGAMTTGAVPVVPQPEVVASTAASAAQTLLQTVIVGLAALAVGLVVFASVRAVAGNDDPVLADPEVREDGLPTVDPGPGDPGRSEGDLADGRGTAAIDGDRDADPGQERTDQAADGTADGSGSTDEDQDGPTSTGGSLESLSSPTGVDGGGRLGSSNSPEPAGPSTTASTAPTFLPSRPIIVGPSVTSPTSTGNTATTASPATTADPPTTTRSTTTTSAPSTTRTSTTRTSTTRPTTTTRPAPSVQIAAPTAGAELSLGATIRLSARAIPGADRYCWTLIQGSTSAGPVCGIGPTRAFSRNDTTLDDLGPGAVTIRLTVEQSGTELGRQSITATLTS